MATAHSLIEACESPAPADGLYLFTQLTANHSIWRATNVTHLPPGPSPPPAPSGSDPFCMSGIAAGELCCAQMCGSCGGEGCGERPGGASSCCSQAISAANRSCDTSLSPCVLDKTKHPPLPTSTIVAHTVYSAPGQTTKVLIVSKRAFNGSASAAVEVCGPSEALGEAGAQAHLFVLSGSEGVVTSATHGVITLAGRTLANSTSGEWCGEEMPAVLTSRQDHRGVCFDVQLAPYSAAMLVVLLART